jgi:carbamoyl-phosphate synthase large subunit
MKPKNILISSAGRRVSLVRDFRQSLGALLPGNKVFAADAKPDLSAACQVADGIYHARRISDPEFMPGLLEFCKSNQIGMVVPTIDTELLIFAEHREIFAAEEIQIIISDSALVTACRDKRKTHALFAEYGIASAAEVDIANTTYPVFSKPAGGSSSIGVYVFGSAEEITPALSSEKGRMFLEYLAPDDHTEFTIDLYYSKNSELKCCVPRQRIEVRSGEVNKGITRKNFLVDYLFQHLFTLKGAKGCITLQLFVNKVTGKKTGIEINPRFGGGYPLSYAAGADFPSMLIREYLMESEPETFHDWEENLLMLRYDDEVLVHGSSFE